MEEEGWVVWCSSDVRVDRLRRILLLGRARAAARLGGSRVLYWDGLGRRREQKES